MQVSIGEMDEHGGVWVTVSGSEQEGDYVKVASGKAAGAIRKYAAENKLGKATRITAGGTLGEQWEYRVRYTFPSVAVDADTVTETVAVTNYMVQANAANDRAFYDRFSAGAEPVPLEAYATDELTQAIIASETRCQMQPIHRANFVPAVAMVVSMAGEYLLACQQCADYFKTVVFCQYSAAHNIRHVPALRFLDCSPIGIVPACAECAEFYAKQKGNEPA